MHEAEGVNFKVGAGQEKDSPKRIRPPSGLRYNNPNLSDILSFIERLPITKKENEILTKAARSVPHGALSNFRKNWKSYLQRKAKS